MAGRRVRVVWAALASYDDALLELLDDDERTRLGGFHQDADRRRFVLGAALLHRELGALTDTGPGAPVVVRTCPSCGRPHGRPRPVATGWWASVTHSGELVAVALTRAGPVGIDVEAPRDVDDATMAVALRPAELAWVLADPSSRQHRFGLMWTAKEAVVKALGTGVPGLDDVELDGADGFRVVRLPPSTTGPVRVSHHDVAGQPVAVALVGAAALRVDVRPGDRTP